MSEREDWMAEETKEQACQGFLVYRERAVGSSPLAWTEVFLRQVNASPKMGVLHFWPMQETVILGQMDTQVPSFDLGLARIQKAGYQPLVRSMGGLGIVADEGVLNVSLILPNPRGLKGDFQQTYQQMADWICQSLADVTDQIEAYEIAQSYCPGRYDLSIGGRKFAGLAQRVYQRAIVVSAYLSLSGNQDKRGQLMADFYQASFSDQPISPRYPQVAPQSMASLSDLLGRPFSVEEMMERLEGSLLQQGFVCQPYQPSLESQTAHGLLQQEIREKMARYGLEEEVE